MRKCAQYSTVHTWKPAGVRPRQRRRPPEDLKWYTSPKSTSAHKLRPTTTRKAAEEVERAGQETEEERVEEVTIRAGAAEDETLDTSRRTCDFSHIGREEKAAR